MAAAFAAPPDAAAPAGPPREFVDRCQQLFAHAWMVRTFVKHSPEVEDFPELMQVVRMIFDTARALETRVNQSADYLRMLDKKLPKLRAAARQFADDAPRASTHTNFVQAVVSLNAVVCELERLRAARGMPPVLDWSSDEDRETAC
jgi:hypothetical protein